MKKKQVAIRTLLVSIYMFTAITTVIYLSGTFLHHHHFQKVGCTIQILASIIGLAFTYYVEDTDTDKDYIYRLALHFIEDLYFVVLVFALFDILP